MRSKQEPRAPAVRPRTGARSINYRVHALESSLFKGAQAYYGRRFSVGVPDMRILSNLGSDGPLTATHLVALTAMDKALVSRILRALHERGLVEAEAAVADPRRRSWSLSPKGRELVERLRPEWRRREALLQAGLTVAERALLGDMLHRLFVASEELRTREAEELAVSAPAGRNGAPPGRKSNGGGRRIARMAGPEQ